jgi:hypothetical protein
MRPSAEQDEPEDDEHELDPDADSTDDQDAVNGQPRVSNGAAR